jgi:hypothetical protein
LPEISVFAIKYKSVSTHRTRLSDRWYYFEDTMKSVAMCTAYWIALPVGTFLALFPLLPLWYRRPSEYRDIIEIAIVFLPVLIILALAYRSSRTARKRILAIAAVGVAINIFVGVTLRVGQAYGLFGTCDFGPCAIPPTLRLLPKWFHLDGEAAWDAHFIEAWIEIWLICAASFLLLRFIFFSFSAATAFSGREAN